MTDRERSDLSWIARFEGLAALDDPVWREISGRSSVITLPSHQVAFREGDPCRQYLLVLDGSIRVQKTGHNGREITLYRVGPGQSCVLTTSCLLAGNTYPAEGITETEVTAAAIPLAAFQQGLAGSDGFRRFVFEAYGTRIANLIMLVEAIAFQRLDERVAEYLVDKCGADGEINVTHQVMAGELGTAREVVSRQLKDFERRGWITLHRGRIRVVDHTALGSLIP